MSGPRRAYLRALVAGAGCLLAASLAAGCLLRAASARAASPNPFLGLARLQGQFLLSGRVTVTRRVRGERRGQSLVRTWTFIPTCPTGACQVIGLIRERPNGTDRMFLIRRRPGTYVGDATFYVPLRCGRRTYPRGEAVPFQVTVAVTALTPVGAAVVASRIDATYVNRSRRNLTPCVEAPGHDAASYHGHLVIAHSLANAVS